MLVSFDRLAVFTSAGFALDPRFLDLRERRGSVAETSTSFCIRGIQIRDTELRQKNHGEIFIKFSNCSFSQELDGSAADPQMNFRVCAARESYAEN